MRFFGVFVALSVLALSARAVDWALCVAGSSGYGNYRHQADAADCYQIFHENGFAAENIITMLYDDVANSPENPRPGKLYNWPGGPDIYTGIVKDYVKDDVTPQNFLKVLQGQDTGCGSGKTIKSTADDRIFVAFFDHGAPGLIAFPNGNMLYAKDLNDALNSMAQGNKFKEMTLYIEACESGSMFNNILADNVKIYAVTAADPDESSWACYYDDTVESYLADCFSIGWMLDTRGHDKGGRTLQQQYDWVKLNTTQSHVCQYGDLSFVQEDISVFMGKKQSSRDRVRPVGDPTPTPTEEVAIRTLQKRLEKATGDERVRLFGLYDEEVRKHNRARLVFRELRRRFPQAKRFRHRAVGGDVCHPSNSLDLDCMKEAVEAYRSECFEVDDYALHNFRHLAKMCDANVNIADVRMAMRDICKNY